MPRLIAVMGPTASGKSAVAEMVAERLDAQLLSADAFQLYRRFDIGTNKPDDRARYLGLDWLEPGETFGVGGYIQRVLPMLADLSAQGRDVVMVGGTGLYFRALLDQWQDLQGAPDPAVRLFYTERLEREGVAALAAELTARAPEVAERIDLRNGARVRRALERLESAQPAIAWRLPPFSVHKIGLKVEVEKLNRVIEARVHEMLRRGWCEEVRDLLADGVEPYAPAFRAIGYAPLSRFVRGEVDRETVWENIVAETRQYAKRQRTWLRSENELRWIPAPDGETNAVTGTVDALFDLLKMPTNK